MLNQDFLLELTKHRNKIVYIRITSLNQQDLPMESIEGQVTGGSINIDGTSAIRRTCSLTMVTQQIEIKDEYWAMKTKFKLEIGQKNDIDNNYPDIIWFDQGIYCITSFSCSHSTTGLQISLSGKDKMTMLDGTLGGVLSTETFFDTYQEIKQDGSINYVKLPIEQVIRNILIQYAGELPHNIIINDLEEYGYELWDYRGDTSHPIYYIYSITQDENEFKKADKIVQYYLDGDKVTVYAEDGKAYKLSDLTEDKLYNRNGLIGKTPRYTFVNGSTEEFLIAKIEYGEVAGYHRTELVYPGELKGSGGETLVSILDKIKTMLGDFEYFYDLYGHFVFQKQKTYVSQLFSPIKDDYVAPFSEVSKYSFKFENTELLTQCSSNPNISEVKNDYVIWGENNSKYPIHARFAIEHKPTQYTTFPHYKRIYLTYLAKNPNGIRYIPIDEDYVYSTNQKRGIGLVKTKDKAAAIGTKVFQEEDKNFRGIDVVMSELYIKTKNGFENQASQSFDVNKDYYILAEDSKSYVYTNESDEVDANKTKVDWRELIYLMARDYYQHNEFPDFFQQIQANNPWCKNGKTGYETFYMDLQGFWRQIYNAAEAGKIKKIESFPSNIAAITSESNKYCVSLRITDTSPGNYDYVFVPVLRYKIIDGNKKSYVCLKSTKDLARTDVDLKEDETDSPYIPNTYIWIDIGPTDTQYNDNDTVIGQLINLEDLTYNIITINEFQKIKESTKELETVYSETINTEPVKFYENTVPYIESGTIKYNGWTSTALYYPENLIFWIDFLDTYGELNNLSISSIGLRTKNDSKSNVKSIYTKSNPEVEFIIMPQEKDMINTQGSLQALSKMMINETLSESFNISSQGQSALQRIDTLIYQHACVANGINLTCIPIYYLEPNTRIYLKEDELKLEGDFIISKMSIPLTYNGTMSITASKVIKQLK